MSGAEVVSLPATAETNFLPDPASAPPELLQRTALVFLCNPANPQGAIGDLAYLTAWIALARTHDFVLVVDECYSEIYDRAAPPGALQAAAKTGGFDNVLVFHSLSKRSNAAGLRAGFVAGDAGLIQRFQALRSYCGPQIPLPVQAAAAALWRDEAHVEENRRRYRAKIDLAENRLAGKFGFYRPPGGFFLWLDVGDGVRSLPGKYLTRPDADGRNSGAPFLRLALVHEETVLAEALDRIAATLE
jgi:aspartate/methionine/tyrosine aminotransferase